MPIAVSVRPGGPLLLGADISQWQPNLAPNNLDFVVAKATQGAGFRDPNFLMHVQTAHARGQIVLAYHFAEYGDGTAGAANFLATISPVLGLLSGVCVDVEYQNETTKTGPTYNDVIGWNQTVAAALPNMARYVYTASYYWGSVLGNPPPPAGTRLWWAHMVPDYNNPSPQALAAQVTPMVPDLPWANSAIRQIGWQGNVGGYQPVDIDATTMTRAELAGHTTEADLTPQESATLTACAKAIVQTMGAINKLQADQATIGKLLSQGDATHVGHVQIIAAVEKIQPGPGGTVDAAAVAAAIGPVVAEQVSASVMAALKAASIKVV